MSEVRRRLPGSPDDYDGHADYLEEFRPPTPLQRVRRILAGLLAIAIGVTVTRLVFVLMDDGTAVMSIFAGIVAFIVGLVGGAFGYSWLAGKKGDEERTGWTRELIAAAFFVLAFVLPVKHNANQRVIEHQRQMEQARRQEAERDALLKARMDKGLEAMRADGRHAPPGVVPPGFEVADRGASVVVTNVGTASTDISLSRVIEDASAPSGWRGCSLYTAGPHGNGRFYGHYINPGMSLTFEMYGDCLVEFRTAPLEYRVSRPDLEGDRGIQAWWSDSAMAKPEGREAEFWQRRYAGTR